MPDESNRPPRPVRVRPAERMAQRLTERAAAPEKPATPGPELHAAVVDPDIAHETAELPATEKPLMGSELPTHVEAEPPAVQAQADYFQVMSPPERDDTDMTQGEFDSAMAKSQPVTIVSGLVADAEAVDQAKREASIAAMAKIQSTDFEVGGPERNFLQGGVPVEHVAESFAARERRAVQRAMDRLRGRR